MERRLACLLVVIPIAACTSLVGLTSVSPSADAGPDAGAAEEGVEAAGDGGVDAGDEGGSLVGYWAFEEGTGNRATDSSGHGHDGTLLNAPTWEPGQKGLALAVSGNAGMQVPSLSPPAFPQAGTLSLWVKADFTTSNSQGIFDDWSDARDHLYVRKYGSGGQLQVIFQKKATDAGPTDYLFGGAVDVPSNTWIHVVVVWDVPSKAGAFYVNGASTTGPITSGDWTPADQQLQIGMTGFVGLVDEVRLYDRALSVLEIPQIP